MRCEPTTRARTFSIIAFQPALRPALPTVYGSLDYRTQRQQFERMDRILAESKLDEEFLALAIKDQGIDVARLSARQAVRFARYSAMCLRANIARKLLGLAHRDFCARLAESPLLQWFLHIAEVDSVKVFAKSTSQRFEQWVSAGSLRAINDRLIAMSSAPAAQGQGAAFGLEAPVVCDEAFFDSTCVKANIHFPTDWVSAKGRTRPLAGCCVMRRAR